MNGRSMMPQRWTNLIAAGAALALLASWFAGIAGASHNGSVLSGHHSLVLFAVYVIPIVFAFGGFVIGLTSSRFPHGLAWRLVVAIWIAFGVFAAFIRTTSPRCGNDGSDYCGLNIPGWIITIGLLQTLFMSSAIGVGMLLAYSRRRQHAPP